MYLVRTCGTLTVPIPTTWLRIKGYFPVWISSLEPKQSLKIRWFVEDRDEGSMLIHIKQDTKFIRYVLFVFGLRVKKLLSVIHMQNK